MKKFINHPEDVVEEMLQGLVTLHPGLARLAGYKVAIRDDAERVRQQQVALVSGGGSGHEPAHAGYVGAGMLSAAVLGEVFTSPSTDSVYAAIKAVAGRPGALLIVKNYTGDRLNFGLAAEMARSEGIAVENVLVDDDVALKDKPSATGARGLAGTVLVHKLLGAAAAEGKKLSELASIGKSVVGALATMGVSFSAGTSPAVGKPSFELAEHEMELGLGIHGEPGAKRVDLMAANHLTETLLIEILKHAKPGTEKRVAVMVNNLGATTEMEIAIVARHAVAFLEHKGFTVERVYAGAFLSSLDMAGISISVLGLNAEWLRWLDAETSAPAWPKVSRRRPSKGESFAVTNDAALTHPAVQSANGAKVKKAVEAACHSLIAAEKELTELDRITGDGDLGISLERGAKAVLATINTFPFDNLAATLKALAHTLGKELGGSSGPLYGVFLLRCAKALENQKPIGEAVLQGCEAISELGGAKAGDRTMLDALEPFGLSLKHGDSLAEAIQAAERGVAATAQMLPRLGRSSYLGDRVLGHPDPGAKAIAIWLSAIANSQRPDEK